MGLGVDSLEHGGRHGRLHRRDPRRVDVPAGLELDLADHQLNLGRLGELSNVIDDEEAHPPRARLVVAGASDDGDVVAGLGVEQIIQRLTALVEWLGRRRSLHVRALASAAARDEDAQQGDEHARAEKLTLRHASADPTRAESNRFRVEAD